MKTVCNTSFRSQIDHGVQHVSRSCHYKTDVTGTLQDQCGGFHKILGSFLHRDTPQESHHFFFRMIRTRNVQQILRKRINGIVHGKTFARVLMILVNNSLTGQLGHTHNTVGMIHAILFHSIYRRIHLTARTVKISSMHMDTQRFATYQLGMHTSRISQPVVRMDNIKFLLARNHPCNNRKIIDLIMKVSRIAAGKLHTPQVIDVHVREIRIDMITESIILFRSRSRKT